MLSFDANCIEKCKAAKKELQGYGDIWWPLASKIHVGDCSYLFHKSKAKSYLDFYQFYIKSSESTKVDLKKRGRSITELIELAKQYKMNVENKHHNYDIPLETYFYDIINHIIIETFDGHKFESIISKILIKKGFIVNEIDGDLDSLCNVDIIAYKNGKCYYIMQVKPISTFIGNKRKDTMDDRVNFFEKEKKLFEEIAAGRIKEISKDTKINKITYVLYDNQEEKLVINPRTNKPSFYLSELCNNKGYSLLDIKNLEKKKIKEIFGD